MVCRNIHYFFFLFLLKYRLSVRKEPPRGGSNEHPQPNFGPITWKITKMLIKNVIHATMKDILNGISYLMIAERQ